MRDRSSYAFAVVSIAVALDLQDGRLANVSIALGGVAHKPWRAERAESVLEGSGPDAELFAQAADAELAHAVGQGHNDFKIELSKRLIVQHCAIFRKAAGDRGMNQQDSRKWIGQPLDRVDGPAKVTGQATYAADYRGESSAPLASS